jgi:hypothetical protein
MSVQSWLKSWIPELVDLGSEEYEERVKKIILFGALVVLVLIVILKRS